MHTPLCLTLVLAGVTGLAACHAVYRAPVVDVPRSFGISAVAPREPLAKLAYDVSPQRLRSDVDALAAFGTRHILSDTASDTRGIGAARRWIKAEFDKIAADRAALGLTTMQVYFDTHTLQPDGRRIDRAVEIANVIAVIPGTLEGTGKAERIYIGGHYDSRNGDEMNRDRDAPGANDDASGTALTIEACRVLSRRSFENTLVFVAFDAEEAGLYGSKKRVEKAIAEGERIRAVLSNDIVGDPRDADGSWHGDVVRVYSDGVQAMPTGAGGGESLGGRPGGAGASTFVEKLRRESAMGDSGSRQLARYVHDIGGVMGPTIHHLETKILGRRIGSFHPMLIFRPDRFLRGGDHTPFHDAGFAAVRFTEFGESYDRQHQDVREENGVHYGDTPEFVDENYLARVTALNVATAAALANAPAAPESARIITAKVENGTTLRWSPPPDADIAGYEVVWRDTTSPLWQSSRDVGLATEWFSPVSKDNAYFGVRAYDKDGYRSLVSFAFAARE